MATTFNYDRSIIQHTKYRGRSYSNFQLLLKGALEESAIRARNVGKSVILNLH